MISSETVRVCELYIYIYVCTCTESSSVGGASLLHLLDENSVHWLQTVPLSPWQRQRKHMHRGDWSHGEEAELGHISLPLETQLQQHCGISALIFHSLSRFLHV